MKIKFAIPYFVYLIFFVSGFGFSQEFPDLKGPYLGQKPPGKIPEVFAKGIISTEESEGCSGFLLNGSVFIFQKFKNRKCYTYEMTCRDNLWSEPKLIPFWELLTGNGDFTIAPDGITMFFQVRDNNIQGFASSIWIVKRVDGEWTKPSPLSKKINSEWGESFASEAANKNLYFFSRRPGGIGKSDLYLSRYKNGKYTEAVNLGANFNTEHHEWDPFIAPDESYIIFNSMKPGGFGGDDFYISFRRKNGSWTEPKNMGDKINSSASENRPYVTLDGKYFFFTSSKSGNRDIYWVSAKVIEELKPEELK